MKTFGSNTYGNRKCRPILSQHFLFLHYIFLESYNIRYKEMNNRPPKEGR